MLEYTLTGRAGGRVSENKERWVRTRIGAKGENSYWTFVDRKPPTIHYDTHLQVGTGGYGDRHISLKDQTVSLPSRWL